MPLSVEVIIPHLHSPIMDASLALCEQMLKENTTQPVNVVVDSRVGVCPYRKWNEACKKSTAEVVVFINNDMLMLPGWESIFTCFEKPDLQKSSVITGRLIESGAVPVNALNIEMDFGRNPQDFKRTECEDASKRLAQQHGPYEPGLGWFMPCAFWREFYNHIGGYEIDAGVFPAPVDTLLFEQLRLFGSPMIRANSWAYHFQRVSLRPEEEKAKA
jgi:hypothetical protein